ncbi:HK97 family phage prohead protease [Cytobacillus oceanisediminis]|uniref:Peptidase U35 n=1 Tax=Cytobacillus oceanisediminis 2691 TaxID=1196031 RepID=A0A161JU62_9BACI|nr:HK97 family phage prohead protease [Cytobacillus oceanisediminis]AND39541.1 peptidase U35 [Cytobacillus oceanisediminis 2691]
MRIEIRGDQVLLDGYVNAVGRESRILPSPNGRFKEQIVPKTFEKALIKSENVDLLFNHEKDKKLGSIKDGNLELREDSIGLRAIATVTDEEVIQKAKDGKLRGWSFGFIANKDKWEDGSDGIQKRFIEDLDLLEVSILDKTPAYIATSIEARGEDSYITEQRNEEFTANIEDNSGKQKEKREESQVDYSNYENEIEFLKLKGGK